LALAFLADFFGAAALDFLADFLAFLAFFADFFEDFFAAFFFAATSFLLFLAFLPFFFLPLAIVVLLLPLIHVYRAFLSRPPQAAGANRSVQSWAFQSRLWTACRPIEKLNRVHDRN